MFRIGQKVICVEVEGAPQLVLNEVYTIKDIFCDGLCRWRGEVSDMASVLLYEAEPAAGFSAFAIIRFRPVVDRKTDISIFKKMLTQPMQVDA